MNILEKPIYVYDLNGELIDKGNMDYIFEKYEKRTNDAKNLIRNYISTQKLRDFQRYYSYDSNFNIMQKHSIKIGSTRSGTFYKKLSKEDRKIFSTRL